MEKRCWFEDCRTTGDSRPMFARAHALPMTLRLCEAHLTRLSRDLSLVSAAVRDPAATRKQPPRSATLDP